MVHKPKSQQNPRPATRPNNGNGARGPPPSPPAGPRFLFSRFDSLNYLAEHPSKADPSRSYLFHLVSRDWLYEMRRSHDKRGRGRLGRVNEDLLRENVYRLPERNTVAGTSHILKSDLFLNYEYDIVTEAAWDYLTAFHQGVPVTGHFELNKEGDAWSDYIRFLSFNLVLLADQGPARTFLLQTSNSSFVSRVAQAVQQEFGAEEELRLAQLDSRLSLSQLLECIGRGEVPGRLLDPESQFSFRYLRDYDIVLAFNPRRLAVFPPQVGISGFCARCRKEAPLDYTCSCVISAYCSVDCKCQDFMEHKAMCKEYVGFREDVIRDLQGMPAGVDRGVDVGLVNIGNSCYLNCLLQVLKTVPAVRESLLQLSYEALDGATFVQGFYHAMTKLLRDSERSVRPWPLKLSLGLVSGQFMNKNQHDASEALDFMLNALDECKIAGAQAVSDTFKGSTVGQFKCKDCLKVQVREVEDAFLLFPVPLVQEPPAKEFTVSVLNEEEAGFRPAVVRVGLKDKEFTLEHLVKIAFNCSALPAFLVSVRPREQTLVLHTDADFQAYVFEKRLNPDAPLPVTIQVLDGPSRCFLQACVAQTFLVGGKFKQSKTLSHPKFLQVAEDRLTQTRGMTFWDIHLRVFQAMKPHIFAAHPEAGRVYREVADKGHPRGEEAFYLALFGLEEPASPPADAQRMVVEGEDPAIEAKYFSQLLRDIRHVLGDKPEPLYVLAYTHRGAKCPLCGILDLNSCLLPPTPDREAPFLGDALGIIPVTVELKDGSKLIRNFQGVAEQENALATRSGPVDRQSFYLRTALDSVFAWEPIERKCEGCGSNNALMQTSIKRHPRILILHLKRFKQDFDRFGNQRVLKRDDYVHYDFEVAVEGVAYELAAVVNHVGNLNDGHYTSAVADAAGSWWDFNDECVSKVRDPTAVRSKANYILFFRQVTPQT